MLIEAGFAASSNSDSECINAVAKVIKDATICSLAKTSDQDISRAAEALKLAKSGRLHLFLATSTPHIEKSCVSRLMGCLSKPGYRLVSDFLCCVSQVVIARVRQPFICPNTVDYAAPKLYRQFIRQLRM